jgi:hypothetical protein
MTANRLRGEAQFEIDGKTFLLRPSFGNLVLAEDELGSLFALVERAAEGKITLAEVSGLIWHCIEADPRPDRETVGRAVLAMGLVAATRPVRGILSEVLQGQA